MDEFTALAYFRTNGLKVTIARLFNTIGPRQTGTYGMVVPRFVSQALRNEALTVFGDGKQTRTFTYVKDVVKALLALVDNEDSFGQVFNIGGTEEVAIFDLAQKIIELTHSKTALEDILKEVIDLEKKNELVGFPQTHTPIYSAGSK